jgi:molybdenum-dependent DNA-binding transcriptional regulator ModE
LGGTPQVPNHHQDVPSLAEGAYKIPEVAEAVRDVWHWQQAQLQNLKGIQLFDLFMQTKREALEAGAKLYKKFVHAKKGRMIFLEKKIGFLSGKAQEKGGISEAAAASLVSYKKELELLVVLNQTRKQRKGKLICIETGGKSNRVFFRKPKKTRKNIKNMSVDDDIADKAAQTDETSVILSNFDAAYKETYRRKVIDKVLLGEI